MNQQTTTTSIAQAGHAANARVARALIIFPKFVGWPTDPTRPGNLRAAANREHQRHATEEHIENEGQTSASLPPFSVNGTRSLAPDCAGSSRLVPLARCFGLTCYVFKFTHDGTANPAPRS